MNRYDDQYFNYDYTYSEYPTIKSNMPEKKDTDFIPLRHSKNNEVQSSGFTIPFDDKSMLYFIIFTLIIVIAIMQMNFSYRLYKLAQLK